MNKVIHEFLEKKIDVLPDKIYGAGHRCSVYLKDGTYLPCVIIRGSAKLVELALKRFEQEKEGKGIFGKTNTKAYEKIVQHFITSGNRINDYDIDRIEESKYAFPNKLINMLQGETTMSWTAFVLEMSDGNLFQFGSSFMVQFFDLPENYKFSEVVNLHNHSYLNSHGKLSSLRNGFMEIPKDYEIKNTFREKPYFDCYVENL